MIAFEGKNIWTLLIAPGFLLSWSLYFEFILNLTHSKLFLHCFVLIIFLVLQDAGERLETDFVIELSSTLRSRTTNLLCRTLNVGL